MEKGGWEGGGRDREECWGEGRGKWRKGGREGQGKGGREGQGGREEGRDRGEGRVGRGCGVVWCNGGSGGYSPGVLKSTTKDECRSSFGCSHTWAVVFVCWCSLSCVGVSFPYVGGRFRTRRVISYVGLSFHMWVCRFRAWAAVFIRGRFSSYVGGRLRMWAVV
jgi:hypothetical protein